MGNTITRAASGETAENAAPKDSQSQAKGQKSNLRKFLYVILLSLRLEQIQSFFVFIKYIWGDLRMDKRRAVVSVVGKDQVGIIAGVTKILADNQVNVLDISQTILQDFFTMMMVVDVSGIENLDSLQKQFNELGEKVGQKINIQREEIFQSMHRI